MGYVLAIAWAVQPPFSGIMTARSAAVREEHGCLQAVCSMQWSGMHIHTSRSSRGACTMWVLRLARMQLGMTSQPAQLRRPVLQSSAAEKLAADRQRIKALTVRQAKPLVPIPTATSRSDRGPRLLESKASLPKSGQAPALLSRSSAGAAPQLCLEYTHQDIMRVKYRNCEPCSSPNTAATPAVLHTGNSGDHCSSWATLHCLAQAAVRLRATITICHNSALPMLTPACICRSPAV